MSDAACYQKLCDHLRHTALLETTQTLLEWDERTMMPRAAGDYRAEQVSAIAGLVHQRRTAPELGEWLQTLIDSPLAADRHSETGCNIDRAWYDYQKHCKLPQSLVEELTRATVLGQQAWSKARGEGNFALFLPHLKTIIRLKREEAEALGYEEAAYDALLDEYEPGARTEEIAHVLASLRDRLVPFVQAIAESDRRPPRDLLERSYPKARQRAFAIDACRRVGFDFERGRLDDTDHPFCTSLGPHDCRILTRYDESFFPTAFFGALHEAGHGMYDQGLPAESYGLPSGSYVSLGVHESQSRFWENVVGRSRAFWQFFLPRAKQAFPAALDDVSLDDFHFAVNDVRPSLIRVEADEVTYNLHIVIRFELEKALIAGELVPEELPAAWNDAYGATLGIRPGNDAVGVLQDIHWSAGLFGYFPTYSLGNLYAAQLLAAVEQKLGDLNDVFRLGEFNEVLQWLRLNIHQYGRRYSAGELMKRATGKPLEADSLIYYLTQRFRPLYGIDV